MSPVQILFHILLMTTADVTTKLAERITFFFSDANFSKDEFMLKEAANNDGYIEISSLLKFNSIKKLSTEMAKIADAAKTVPSVIVSKDGEAIRRKDPLPDKNDSVERTIFVGNIPVEDDKTWGEAQEKEAVKEGEEEEKPKEGEEEKPKEGEEKPKEEEKKATPPQLFAVTIDDIKSTFSKFGEVALVRLRYKKAQPHLNLPKSAMGSAFVEFGSAEAVAKAAENTEEIKVGSNVVEVKVMKDWLADNKKSKPKKTFKKKEDTKKSNDEGTNDEPAAEEAPLVIEPLQWEKNCVIAFTRFPPEIQREDIKEAFSTIDGVNADDVYVDYSRGCKDGAVRFSKTFDTITDVAAKFDKGEVKIKGEPVGSACVLLGEEEEKYWEEAARQSAERKRAFEARGGHKNRKKQRRN
ncbi:hypothetical protein TrCOL_g12496 [Triparma columacea]|uniref:Lupus La protein n=1 Tax=Triparma columacea TaxID=722753 RepID=A0A9W7GNS1_9STRA|nr:hypothetical protein TrCOL_g12496 [Triparma columacea]